MNDDILNNAHISAVNDLINEDVPTTMKELETALARSMKLTGTILAERVEAYLELQTKRRQFWHPKDNGLTEWDRRILLDTDVKEYQAKYDLLVGLEKLLEQRIEVIKTLLSL